MKQTFGDTSYFLALLMEDDAHHDAAIHQTATLTGLLVITHWVVVEVANALAAPASRQRYLAWWKDCQRNSNVVVVPADQQLFDRGLDLYARRPDKAWSLTDCISFVTMEERGIAEALTGDRHFEQAGFKALLA